jgi:hypothetical protein
MHMPPIYVALDPYLIWFYRLPSNEYAGFLLGTFVLALICMFLGDITFALAARLQGKHLDNIAAETTRYQDLSIDAAKAGDQTSFRLTNKLANESFGKSFFSLIALSMAQLWPIPFALAWMQYRFLGVGFPIPGTHWSLGFIGMFVLIYIAAHFLIKYVKKGIAYFYRLRKMPDAFGRLLLPAEPSQATKESAGKVSP